MAVIETGMFTCSWVKYGYITIINGDLGFISH